MAPPVPFSDPIMRQPSVDLGEKQEPRRMISDIVDLKEKELASCTPNREEFPFLGVARDVHDTHKHGRLHRRSAKIRQAQKPTTVDHGGSGPGFGPIADGSLASGPIQYLVITADDGRTHKLGSVIAQCEEHLKAKVQRFGS